MEDKDYAEQRDCTGLYNTTSVWTTNCQAYVVGMGKMHSAYHLADKHKATTLRHAIPRQGNQNHYSYYQCNIKILK